MKRSPDDEPPATTSTTAVDGSAAPRPAAPADASNERPSAPADAPQAASADARPAADGSAPAGFHVLTNKYDNARLAWNSSETKLNVANVNTATFGKLFSRAVTGQIYAQPLYVSNLAVPGKGTHNVVFVATMHNDVYAFDADDPAARDPLWTVNLGPNVPYAQVCGCKDIYPEVGVTATPVIDLGRHTIYLLSKHVEAGAYAYRLDALDIATGMHRPGSPVVVKATVTLGKNMVSFDPKQQHGRAGLLLLDGRVYFAFASHGDGTPFYGWVMGYDADKLTQTGVYVPSTYRSGIWQSGSGLAADDAGNIYFATGNGDSNPDPANLALGQSLIKLSTTGGTLALADWYMVGNYKVINGVDLDLGSAGPTVIPKTTLVMTGSKEGMGYALDRNNLGHWVADDSQVVRFKPAEVKFAHQGGFVYWEGPSGPMVFAWPSQSKLLGFRIADGKVDIKPALVGPLNNEFPGGFLSVSSHGSAAGTGILWASSSVNMGANQATVPGMLRALDATTLKELWTSLQNKDRDDSGLFAKFVPPVVANGKVYLASFSGALNVYGLLPP